MCKCTQCIIFRFSILLFDTFSSQMYNMFVPGFFEKPLVNDRIVDLFNGQKLIIRKTGDYAAM